MSFHDPTEEYERGSTLLQTKYVLTRKFLGQGKFGSVWKGTRISDGLTVAVKIIPRSKITSKKLKKNLDFEISILKTLDHPNILKLFDSEETSDFVYMFFEYCGNGDLKDMVKMRGGILENYFVQKFVREIACGILELYKKKVVHRDIKMDNIFVTSSMICKIGDFGLARNVSDVNLASTFCGTPLYMAPEILGNNKYDSTADLYSLGVLLYELLYGTYPVIATSMEELKKKALRKHGIKFPKSNNVSKDAVDLMKRLLKPNPVNRISFQDFFKHKYINIDMTTPKPASNIEHSIFGHDTTSEESGGEDSESDEFEKERERQRKEKREKQQKLRRAIRKKKRHKKNAMQELQDIKDVLTKLTSTFVVQGWGSEGMKFFDLSGFGGEKDEQRQKWYLMVENSVKYALILNELYEAFTSYRVTKKEQKQKLEKKKKKKGQSQKEKEEIVSISNSSSVWEEMVGRPNKHQESSEEEEEEPQEKKRKRPPPPKHEEENEEEEGLDIFALDSYRLMLSFLSFETLHHQMNFLEDLNGDRSKKLKGVVGKVYLPYKLRYEKLLKKQRQRAKKRQYYDQYYVSDNSKEEKEKQVDFQKKKKEEVVLLDSNVLMYLYATQLMKEAGFYEYVDHEKRTVYCPALYDRATRIFEFLKAQAHQRDQTEIQKHLKAIEKMKSMK